MSMLEVSLGRIKQAMADIQSSLGARALAVGDEGR